MILHKKDIIDKISGKTGLYKKDIKEMLDAFKELIYEELEEGNEISLNNMFNIKTVPVKAGEKFNPLLKVFEYRDEHRTVKLYPSANLKQSIRKYDKKDDEADEELIIERQIAALQARKLRLKSEKYKK